MKKFIICLLFIVNVFPIFAKVVSINEARIIAESFLRKNVNTRSISEMQLLLDGNDVFSNTVTRSTMTVNSPFFVYGYSEGGFVIVAGDDIMYPILGYSYNESFSADNIPDPVREWMKGIAEMASLADQLSIEQDKAVEAEWKSYKSGITRASSTEKVLNTVLWDQGEPFNRMTPTLRSDGNCSTGCTNTATAIVMMYHKWPKAGRGVLPDYEYDADQHRTMKGHALGHEYDWDNMPFSKDSYTEEQAHQVSQLMYDCGVMNKCKYNPYNSDTDPKNIPLALIRFMDYDKDARYISRDNYSDTDWEGLIISEIESDRPVIYGGNEPSNEGHCWVLDGYNDNGFYHMNWGWSGASNGFYKLTPMSESGLNFVKNHRMVIGIKPNTSTEPVPSEISVTDVVTNFNFEFNEEYGMCRFIYEFLCLGFENKETLVSD